MMLSMMASSPSAASPHGSWAHANGDANHGLEPRQQPRRGRLSGAWAWIERKIFLYNVTTGLYMLDWWERYVFNAIVLLLLWIICYNGLHYAGRVVEGTVTWHKKSRGGLQGSGS